MHSVFPAMSVKVLFFGRARELTGLGEETAEVTSGMTVAELFERYVARYPELDGFRASLAPSRNQEFAAWNARLAPGDEIAFLPPVSGG